MLCMGGLYDTIYRSRDPHRQSFFRVAGRDTPRLCFYPRTILRGGSCVAEGLVGCRGPWGWPFLRAPRWWFAGGARDIRWGLWHLPE
jgi:hypothetical protein